MSYSFYIIVVLCTNMRKVVTLDTCNAAPLTGGGSNVHLNAFVARNNQHFNTRQFKLLLMLAPW